MIDLESDRHPIRLADANMVFSDGKGSMRLVSSCGFKIVINHVPPRPRPYNQLPLSQLIRTGA